MAFGLSDRAARTAGTGLIALLRASCNAFDRYEALRHMSEEQLGTLGITRYEICDELFAELYGHPKTSQRERHRPG